MQLRNLLVLTLVLVSTVLGACATSLTPVADTSVEPVTIDAYAKPEVLVDTAWVQEHLEDPSVRLIHAGNANWSGRRRNRGRRRGGHRIERRGL